MMGNNPPKLLFFHNTIPEYRIEFWNKLSQLVDLTVFVLEPELESHVYGFDIGERRFKILKEDKYEEHIKNANAIVLPPIDDLKCIKATIKIKRLCRKYDIPYFFWTEKWEAPIYRTPLKKRIKNILQRRIFKICSSGSRKCIAAGSKSKEYLKKIGINEKDICVSIDSSTSPCGKNINIYERYSIENGKKVILYLGRIIKRKGCDVLIRACREHLNSWNAVLLVCGSGDFLDACKELAKDKEIIFTGKIQPYERRSFYNQSDVFVLPSVITDGVIEGWGLSVNEALECGTPVITTKAVGSGYDLINPVTGKMIDDNNVEQLQKAIEEILISRRERQEIIESFEQFNVENMARSFIENIFEFS